MGDATSEDGRVGEVKAKRYDQVPPEMGGTAPEPLRRCRIEIDIGASRSLTTVRVSLSDDTAVPQLSSAFSFGLECDESLVVKLLENTVALPQQKSMDLSGDHRAHRTAALVFGLLRRGIASYEGRDPLRDVACRIAQGEHSDDGEQQKSDTDRQSDHAIGEWPLVDADRRPLAEQDTTSP